MLDSPSLFCEKSKVERFSLISKELFDTIFLHKDDDACPVKNFYTCGSFINASSCFPKFGRTGSLTKRKREIAAFLGQISYETSGGWPNATNGPYAWGLCYKEEISPKNYSCNYSNQEWPCFPGKSYKGKCPIQITW